MPAAFDGEIYREVGKYARGAILFAFEQIGGPRGLAEWAQDNPDDFYTKLFPKIVTREVEVARVRTVDDLMDVVDADYTVEGSPAGAAPDQAEAGGVEAGWAPPTPDAPPRWEDFIDEGYGDDE